MWLAELSDELGLDLDLGEDDVHAVLDLARDAAHQVTRPAAPLTTFLAGVAVGRGATVGATTAAATRLALSRDETRTV
ncbi:molybdopterin-guanine dinucleotide biosynthesis protein [Auraticoccus sp. F435]|uniref:Molybdopterin-guanine dinucleotide biosynthesis protein n=1 Tax=Auraticoccus cholistanensis TaxID=2656650 RepID=A0A6A9UZE6_9ACTN|nr:molybdopterin-guanine dinucleotide biosynthesis protein [Auraticoccus cholistanensis]